MPSRKVCYCADSGYTRDSEITLFLPDDIAAAMIAVGPDPGRAALEAWGVQAYRERRITGYQLRTLPGIGSGYELDGLLKSHGVFDYTVDDLAHDLAHLQTLPTPLPYPAK